MAFGPEVSARDAVANFSKQGRLGSGDLVTVDIHTIVLHHHRVHLHVRCHTCKAHIHNLKLAIRSLHAQRGHNNSCNVLLPLESAAYEADPAGLIFQHDCVVGGQVFWRRRRRGDC